MWLATSKLELFGLTMNSKDNVKLINTLKKRIDKGEAISRTSLGELKLKDIFKDVKKGWIKRLDKILLMEEYKQEDAIDRVLQSIYDFGDANRIWVT